MSQLGTSIGAGYNNASGSYIGSRPSASPGGARVLFSSPRSGDGDIYTMRFDGTDWKRLTYSQAYEGEPVFSPNESKIAFVSTKDGNQEIYLMGADGSNQVRLTNTPGYANSSPSFSPDGSQLIFIRRMHTDPVFWNKNEIFTMKINGSDLRRLTSNEVSEWAPSFSPDGKKIIFGTINSKTTKFEIWLMDADGSNARLLLENASNPVFSPDGKLIAFISDTLKPYDYEIYVADSLTGGNVRQVTNLKQYISSVNFFEDDSKLIFLVEPERNGFGLINSINLNGSELKTITKNY